MAQGRLSPSREIRKEHRVSPLEQATKFVLPSHNYPMILDEFIWPEERIEHIAEHGVTPEKLEEACFGNALVLRAKSEGENPVYYRLGPNHRGPLLILRGNSFS